MDHKCLKNIVGNTNICKINNYNNNNNKFIVLTSFNEDDIHNSIK